MSEPSRPHDLNSLSEAFGISFRQDYLYNVVDHDRNHANVFIRDFEPHRITERLQQITLFTASSIKHSGTAIADADINTYSSVVERVEPFLPLVYTEGGKVVAISDLTLFISPQDAISDTGRLIANMAAYLTQGNRSHDLADFPNFFQDDVDILMLSPDLFSQGTEVRNLLADFQLPSAIARVADFGADTVFVGLYQDASQVVHYLDAGGVGVGETLRTPFTSDISPAGTSVLMLQQEGERNVLLILGHSPVDLAILVQALRTGQFRAGLVEDLLGVYG